MPGRQESGQHPQEQEVLIDYFQALLAEREQIIQNLQAELFALSQSPAWAIFQKAYHLRERLKSALGKGEGVRPKPAGGAARAETPPSIDGMPGAREQRATLVSTDTAKVIETLLGRSRELLRELQGNDVRVIAFYLPQFHPIPENDRWWGKGFTEWTNVAKAQPNFEGHYQPHLPSDLGFYDLRLPEVREQQAELAREYGVHGFCYHHYWFGGRRLLERPFNEVLASGRPDFPFCICWANENWTRRWDGAEHEILMGQNHSDQDDRDFIRSLFPAFEDRRYIRIHGKPLLIVYRANILPDARRTADIWREEMKQAGLGDIYLCAAQSFGLADPRSYGFESAVEFPPHGPRAENLAPRVSNLSSRFAGAIHDYTAKANSLIHKPATEYTLFKTVMPAWDNTARRQHEGIVYINSSPEAYEYWLGKAVEIMITRCAGDERLVFVNAWNEWGEGAHLEPDRQYGRGYLEATRRVLEAVQRSM
jgi:lipopolysaccharide biosynthesis protein